MLAWALGGPLVVWSCLTLLCLGPALLSWILYLSVHEEAKRERDRHGPVSKLLFTAHGPGGGGVVGGVCR